MPRALSFLTALLLSAFAGCGGDGDTTTYTMPSEAMEPAYSPGDEVTVDHAAYDDARPAIGDVVTFHPPVGADAGRCGVRRPPGGPCPAPTQQLSSDLFLKRVVALPGDRLFIRDGLPVVDGSPELTDVIQVCMGCDLPQPITIPPGHYFVIGDNSGSSDDSRFWGPVPLAAITGKAE